jgi:hypothetical protein
MNTIQSQKEHDQRMTEATIRKEARTLVFEYPIGGEAAIDIFLEDDEWFWRSSGAPVGQSIDAEIDAEIRRRAFERARALDPAAVGADLEDAVEGVRRAVLGSRGSLSPPG